MAYATTVEAVQKAIRSDITTEGKWESAGNAVRNEYANREVLEEVKAQFMADAIVPALDPKHQKALSTELVRKGSKEFKAMDATQQAQWETANKAKKDARAIRDTYFSRILNYAFPKEKETSAETPTSTPETRIIELINDAIKKCEKGENLGFDVPEVIKHLKAALASASK
jgi:hypothetical protein